MKKRKVIGFFIVLLLVAGFVLHFQISRYGSIGGMVVGQDLGDSFLDNDKKTIFGKVWYVREVFSYIGFFIISLFILGYVIRFLYRHNLRTNMGQEGHFERKFIKMDFG